MEQCKLRWFSYGELQSYVCPDNETMKVVALPLPNNKEVPPKFGVYIYPKKAH
jgi:hypothetical protein